MIDHFWLESLWKSSWKNKKWKSKEEKEIIAKQKIKIDNYLDLLENYFKNLVSITEAFTRSQERKLTILSNSKQRGKITELSIFMGQSRALFAWDEQTKEKTLLLTIDSRKDTSFQKKNHNLKLEAKLQPLGLITWLEKRSQKVYKEDELKEFVLLELNKVSSYYEDLFEKNPNKPEKDSYDSLF